MSAVANAMSHLLAIPGTLKKLIAFNSRGVDDAIQGGDGGGNRETKVGARTGSIPVDILDSPKEYIVYMDVPGLSKSDIQVTVEDENTLVVRSNRKKKREEGEEEGCKYLRLDRMPPQKLLRKFRLPEITKFPPLLEMEIALPPPLLIAACQSFHNFAYSSVVVHQMMPS